MIDSPVALIWNLSTIKKWFATAADLGEYCVDRGIRALSFKVAGGMYVYTRTVVPDFGSWLETLRAFGLEVGGWHYNYPNYIDQQIKVARELIAAYDLDHYLLDAEKEFKVTGGALAARRLCDGLVGVKLGFCSYRYPEQHGSFPFRAFVEHKAIKFVAPQVYWQNSHNPGYQITKSHLEYLKLSSKPFVPIGSFYGAGSWVPTDSDIDEFCSVASGDFSGWGFYSLDWVLGNSKTSWMELVKKYSGSSVPPPPPPPVFSVGDTVRLATGSQSLWTHKVPNTLATTRNGYLPPEILVRVEEVATVSGRPWLRSGSGWFAGWMVEVELEPPF